MKTTTAPFAKLFAAMSLLVAVFVIVPSADALSCTFELPISQQSLSVHLGEHDQTEQDNAATCAHGHCHHTSSERIYSQIEAENRVPSPLLRQFWLVNEYLESRAPDGLMRPPKT